VKLASTLMALASFTATGGRAVVTMTSSTAGVRDRSVVASTARYCTYLPGAAIGTNALQVPSGVAVLPVRMLIAALVPAGVTLFQNTVFQVTFDMASN